MSSSFLTIEFPGSKKFNLSLESSSLNEQSIPYWAKFSHMPCPGNIEHGPSIDYCRLGIEIENLIKCFSNFKSIENGVLTMHYDECIEIRIKSDAQTIFYNCLWFILLHSNCSVFKYSQWARSNYLPSSDPDRLFYMLFSIFLIEDFVVMPNLPPSVERFKEQMQMLRNVLNNLLGRIRNSDEIKSDSVSNGIVLFSNLVLLLDMEFDQFYIRLKETINMNNVLEKWV